MLTPKVKGPITPYQDPGLTESPARGAITFSKSLLVERTPQKVALAANTMPATPKTPKTPKRNRRPFTVLNSPSLDSRAFGIIQRLANATHDSRASILNMIGAAPTPVRYAPVTPGPFRRRPHDS